MQRARHGQHQTYDLLATKHQEKDLRRSEGTTSQGDEVILTRGEVEHYRKHYSDNAFVIVYSRSVSLTSDGIIVVDRGMTHRDRGADAGLFPLPSAAARRFRVVVSDSRRYHVA